MVDTGERTAATRGSVRGLKIAYSPNLDIFPVDRGVAETVNRAVRVFEKAGAHVEEVKLGIKRSHKELTDAWSGLYMLLNLHAFENMKKQNGIDLLGQHRDEFPPQYLEWVEKASRISGVDFHRNQVVRSDVFNALQGVLSNFGLLVTPTSACPPVDNANDGNTVGPSSINGVEIDPLVGWAMTYFINFSGHPAASVPAGLSNGLPIGMQIIGRRNADMDVLAASAAFERPQPWHENYEICRNRSLGV